MRGQDRSKNTGAPRTRNTARFPFRWQAWAVMTVGVGKGNDGSEERGVPPGANAPWWHGHFRETTMQRRDINAANAPAPAGVYSQAVHVTGGTHMLWISGQVGAAIDGNVPADAFAQAKLAWASLIAQLEAADMGVDNIVKLVTIVPDAGDIPATRAARSEVMGDRKPASTLIVAGLANPAWKVEIEAVAVA